MKSILFTLLLLVCTLTGTLLAQACPFPQQEEIFHGNAIRTIISNTGNLFQGNNLEAQFQVPFTGPATPHVVFAGGLWLGAYDDVGNLKMAAQTFKYATNLEYTPGPLNSAGMSDSVICDLWDRIWMVSRNEILMHLSDYADNGQIDKPIVSVLGWPGRDNPEFETYHAFPLSNASGFGAPFADLNDNDVYEPLLGEYPHPENVAREVLPMSIAWTVFSDSPNLHRVTNGDPLRAEVQLTMYAFSCDEESVMNETLFVSFKVANRSTEVRDSLFLGQWLDPDLGCHTDDLFGSYPDGNSFFIYNEDAVDGHSDASCPGGPPNTYGAYPPVLSTTFLNRELSSFMYYRNSGVGEPEPGTGDPRFGSPVEFYRYLTGSWRDGTPLTVGDDGHETTPGEVTQYAFPGDPSDPESWTMINIDPGFYDHRVIGSVALPDLNPGGYVTVDMAFAFHRDSSLSNTGNVTLMYEQVDALQALYDKGFVSECTYSDAPCTADCVYPGDADADGKVDLQDYLNTALGQYTQGPGRTGPVAFTPLEAEFWEVETTDGVNYKHLDCNGDGMIMPDDFGLTDLYYGMQAPWHIPAPDISTGDEIQIIASSHEFVPGTAFFQTTIRWASADIDSLYGLVFAFEYDTSIFEQVIPNGIAELFADSLTLFRQYNHPGRLEYIVTAHDLQDRTIETGQLMRPVLFARDDISVSGDMDTTHLSIVDARAVLSDGTILDIGGQRIPLYILNPVSSTSEYRARGFKVYPNPSYGQVHIENIGLPTKTQVSIFSIDGKPLRDHVLGVSLQLSLPSGMYYIVVRGNEVQVEKVVVTQ
jgi:hypothetical protein